MASSAVHASGSKCFGSSLEELAAVIFSRYGDRQSASTAGWSSCAPSLRPLRRAGRPPASLKGWLRPTTVWSATYADWRPGIICTALGMPEHQRSCMGCTPRVLFCRISLQGGLCGGPSGAFGVDGVRFVLSAVQSARNIYAPVGSEHSAVVGLAMLPADVGSVASSDSGEAGLFQPLPTLGSRHQLGEWEACLPRTN